MARDLINRSKTSEGVVEYVMGEIFAGRLRSGERVDLFEVADSLGISRSPVREALVILERDGIVAIRHHRGVFVEPFDAPSILDDFEVLGLLSGLAVKRVAAGRDREVIARLELLVERLKDAATGEEEGKLVQEILRTEHRAGGSRRLRAELRAGGGFIPWVFRVSSDRGPAGAYQAHRPVVEAIAAGDGEAAAAHRLADFTAAGRRVVADLRRRGVLE